jgi:hypothetical protein
LLEVGGPCSADGFVLLSVARFLFWLAAVPLVRAVSLFVGGGAVRCDFFGLMVVFATGCFLWWLFCFPFCKCCFPPPSSPANPGLLFGKKVHFYFFSGFGCLVFGVIWCLEVMLSGGDGVDAVLVLEVVLLRLSSGYGGVNEKWWRWLGVW